MTEKRIKKHGPGVELNPITRSLARKYGASLGSFLGIMLPNAVVLSLLAVFHFDIALGFVAGIRSMLTILQLKSIEK